MSGLSGTWTVSATPKKRWTVGTPFAGFSPTGTRQTPRQGCGGPPAGVSPTGTRQTPRQKCGGPTCRLQSHLLWMGLTTASQVRLGT